MRRWLIASMLAGMAGTAPAAAISPSPVQALAGRYSEHFRNGNIDGDKYWSDDVVEIEPVDPNHAYFRISLQFFNGHGCGLFGIATAVGSALEYRSGPQSYDPDCHMTIRRDGKWLKLDDHDGTCQSSCGARGGFGGDGLPWSSKRPIAYRTLLRNSPQYRRAISEWRNQAR